MNAPRILERTRPDRDTAKVLIVHKTFKLAQKNMLSLPLFLNLPAQMATWQSTQSILINHTR